MQLTKQTDYRCDVKHLQITKIMADNILQEHIRFLGTQHNLYNIIPFTIYLKIYYSFDNTSMKFNLPNEPD